MTRIVLHPLALLWTAFWLPAAAADPGQTLPGPAFQDCPECPVMVVIPPGTFAMGSPPSEAGRFDHEGPPHEVRIGTSLAVGAYEVTFAQWDACFTARGCSHRPDDHGWGRDQRPVINVTWHDAHQYVRWLSRRTGRTYRLLSEAEWEYAARAGTDTARYWGPDIGAGLANCDGCGSRWDGRHSAPVGSFAANGFGLHDMLGNVFEWTEDCGHHSYGGAPSDGTAWTGGGDCALRVLRGGSWNYAPRGVRAAFRLPYHADYRDDFFGFRVARTLGE